MIERPRICILDASIAVTGALLSARCIAQTMQDKAQFSIVLPKVSDVDSAALSVFSAVHYASIITPSKRAMKMVCYVPTLLMSSWKLRRLLREENVQIVLLNDFYLMHGAVLRLLGWRGRILVMVRCHPVKMFGAIAKPMLWLSRKTANQTVAVSHYIRKAISPPDDAVVLYDAFFGEARTEIESSAQHIKPLVMVGNYIRGKGQDVALEAFAIAHQQNPSLRLHFYGGDMGLAKNKAYLEDLKQRAKALGVEGVVEFHGFIHNAKLVLRGAYASLNCSVSESFSLTVLEASGNGLPVIATRSGGPQEIIVEGETGLLAPVGDVQAIAQHIITLSFDAELAKQMGRRGAEHVRGMFSPEKYHEMLSRLLAL